MKIDKGFYFLMPVNVLFIAIIIFSFFTSGKKLNEMGLDNITFFSLFVPPMFSFFICKYLLRNKDLIENKYLWWFNLISFSAIFLLPFAILIYGFVRTVFMGMSV